MTPDRRKEIELAMDRWFRGQRDVLTPGQMYNIIRELLKALSKAENRKPAP